MNNTTKNAKTVYVVADNRRGEYAVAVLAPSAERAAEIVVRCDYVNPSDVFTQNVDGFIKSPAKRIKVEDQDGATFTAYVWGPF